ncbi:hypothetical protein AB0D45_26045 [Streptomyces sp. NPDC048352]
MSAAHTTGMFGNVRPTAPVRPLCTAAGTGRSSSRADDNGWD